MFLFMFLFMGLALLVIRLATLGLLPMTARLLPPLDALLETILAIVVLGGYFVHNLFKNIK